MNYHSIVNKSRNYNMVLFSYSKLDIELRWISNQLKMTNYKFIERFFIENRIFSLPKSWAICYYPWDS
jgi:CO dehydrogenase/acetyl-CoA synthase delta subunit